MKMVSAALGRPRYTHATTDVMMNATTIPTGMPSARMVPRLGGMTPCRVTVALGHPELAVDLLHLDHDIDETLEQRAYVIARQVRAALAFLHEQTQLLERQLARVRMSSLYRTGSHALLAPQIDKCPPPRPPFEN